MHWSDLNCHQNVKDKSFTTSLTISLSFTLQILNEIAQHKIRIYEFPDCEQEEESKHQKKLKVSIALILSMQGPSYRFN